MRAARRCRPRSAMPRSNRCRTWPSWTRAKRRPAPSPSAIVAGATLGRWRLTRLWIGSSGRTRVDKRRDDHRRGRLRQLLVNERIRAAQIRVIGEEGAQLGVMTPADALRLARERGLDLVEVGPPT